IETKTMSLLYWNCIIIVQILMEIISCQNIGIHELSHDYNLKKIDVQHVQKLPSFLDTSITYQYRYEPLPNTTVRYFLAKPWRLRYVEFHDRIHDVRILHRQAQIRFDRVRRTHEGIYSLYQFYFQQTSSHADHDYDDDDDDDLKQNSPSNHARLVHYTRRDFNLVVHGLKKEREFCRDNAECESGSCPSFYCVCNRQTPVWLEMAKICLETKNINDTCHDHIECQWNGGPEAECFKHQWSRCRCRKPSVAIKISSHTVSLRSHGFLKQFFFVLFCCRIKMEEQKKDDKSTAATAAGSSSGDADAGACSKIMSQLDNLIRTHGVHVVALAALACIGLHIYNRYASIIISVLESKSVESYHELLSLKY
ncbi:hypothetical protein DERF_002319, partial [Dermatophagoides farinae]